MKKFYVLFVLFLSFSANSQVYKTAFGVKLSYPGVAALNGKFYVGDYFALDNGLGVNLDLENRFFQLQSILEFNKQIGIRTGYNWYVGLGPNLQYYTKGSYLLEKTNTSYDGLFLKVDAVGGIEVFPEQSHFNAAFEAGPTIHVYPFVKPGFFVSAALRYAIKYHNSKTVR